MKCAFCETDAKYCMMNQPETFHVLCDEHLREKYKLEVKPSQIKNAGLGLFTTCAVKKGKLLGVFGSRRVVYRKRNEKKIDEFVDRYYEGDYDLLLKSPKLRSEDVLLLCQNPLESSVFRFMNDAIGPDRRTSTRIIYLFLFNNVREEDIVHGWYLSGLEVKHCAGIKIAADVDIPKGGELFYDYGCDYWKYKEGFVLKKGINNVRSKRLGQIPNEMKEKVMNQLNMKRKKTNELMVPRKKWRKDGKQYYDHKEFKEKCPEAYKEYRRRRNEYFYKKRGYSEEKIAQIKALREGKEPNPLVIREKRNDYIRKWFKDNPDKYAKRLQYMREYIRERRRRQKNAYDVEYRKRNKKRINEYNAQYRKRPEYVIHKKKYNVKYNEIRRMRRKKSGQGLCTSPCPS